MQEGLGRGSLLEGVLEGGFPALEGGGVPALEGGVPALEGGGVPALEGGGFQRWKGVRAGVRAGVPALEGGSSGGSSTHYWSLGGPHGQGCSSVSAFIATADGLFPTEGPCLT